MTNLSGLTTSRTTPNNPGSTDERYLQQLLQDLAQAKVKLDEGKAASTAMLNSLGEGLIVTDEHGRITTINTYALKCLGFEEKDLIGKWMPKSIIAVDQFARPINQLNRPTVRSLTTGQTITDSIYYLTKTGDMLPVRLTVSPILVGDVPTGTVEIFQDLTKEHQLDIAKNEFVSLASHQLRTPATAMKSILSMLASGDFGPLSKLQQKYIDKAIQTNDRQLQIIEDLLNVALVDSGKLELDLDLTNLAGILRDVAADHAAILEDRDQTITVNCPDNAVTLVDIQKVRMVIDNLISNASKYSPSGAAIRVELREMPDGIQLCVCDQGIGIPKEELPRLFTKFTRLSNELSASVGGTGLGLFLSKSIVELHGGTITVSSKENIGSTFTATFPTTLRRPSD